MVSPQFTAGELRRVTAGLRDVVHILHEDTETLHRDAQEYDLQERAALKNRLGATALLSELSEVRGLSWNDMASAVSVSLSAVRKWRHGGECSPENRMTLARVAAVLDLLDEAFVSEPGGWLLTPVLPGYSVRFLDLMTASRDDLVLDYAFNRKSATEVLDAFDPEWRDRYGQTFDVVTDGDGIRSLARRAR